MSRGDIIDEMTASYSEICEGQEEEESLRGMEELPMERPRKLNLVQSRQENRLNQLDGTVMKEGDMISFVAVDLENKIKLSSPTAFSVEHIWESRSSGGGELRLLEELEAEASALAASIDSLTEALAETLHGISALTVDCLEAYRDVVCRACDAVDSNIKAMYQLMAKCEELSKSMAPIYKLAAHIKNIKHLLDLLEASPS